jgi:hypothetical protein
MSRLWSLLDRQGEWVRRHFPPQNQIRLGMSLIWVGVAMHIAVAFSSEPPLIAQMSAFAILVGGFGFVVTAVLAKSEEESNSNE